MYKHLRSSETRENSAKMCKKGDYKIFCVHYFLYMLISMIMINMYNYESPMFLITKVNIIWTDTVFYYWTIHVVVSTSNVDALHQNRVH